VPLKEGFLGTAAPGYADVVLIFEIALGLGLLAGAILARMQRFRAHAFCQSVVVLANLVIIVVIMAPSFHSHVSPRIPVRLSRPYYALATVHAALGTITECAGLYILLATGTTFLPEKLRLKRYKLWMRLELMAWWTTLALGLATYGRWYTKWF
jgi:hypothetical protein